MTKLSDKLPVCRFPPRYYAGLADCYMLLEQYAGVPSNETAAKTRATANLTPAARITTADDLQRT